MICVTFAFMSLTLCRSVFLVSLLLTLETWVLRTQLNILDGAFFAKIANGEKLKFSTAISHINY